MIRNYISGIFKSYVVDVIHEIPITSITSIA